MDKDHCIQIPVSKTFEECKEQKESFHLQNEDEMLNMGSKDQVYDLIECLPKEAQVCLFSETMPQEALGITEKSGEKFMRDLVRVLIKKDEVTLDGMDQYFEEQNNATNWADACDTDDPEEN